MKNFLKTVFMSGAKYRALISIFLLNILTNGKKVASLGLTNLAGLVDGDSVELRMQTYFYRSVKTQSANNQIQLVDTSVVAVDGVTNLNNGQLPNKDSIFGVGAIAIRFATGGTAGAPASSTYSNALYDSAGALRIPVGLQNADIEIKCGNYIVLERQTIKKFFAERNINVNSNGTTQFEDAVELTEPAFLVGGQPISAIIYMPNGAAALVATAQLELEFYGVGTGNK